MLKFRALRADEVDCRIAMCKEGGLSLLLYKDARCDMNILDETVGPERWQRHHSRDNANCTVAIYFPEMGQWVEKEDTGTESNTEAEKGLASDSFKRACFNWGIGRELYTAPFIWVTSDRCNIKRKSQGAWACYDRFGVSEMEVEDGRITRLVIVNESRNGEVTYQWERKPKNDAKKAVQADNGDKEHKPIAEEKNASQGLKMADTGKLDETQINLLRIAMSQIGQAEEPLLKHYGLTKLEDMALEQYQEAMAKIKSYKDKRRKKA